MAVLNVNRSEFSDEKYMLMIQTDNKHLDALRLLIHQFDKNAFIMVHETKLVYNGFFKNNILPGADLINIHFSSFLPFQTSQMINLFNKRSRRPSLQTIRFFYLIRGLSSFFMVKPPLYPSINHSFLFFSPVYIYKSN